MIKLRTVSYNMPQRIHNDDFNRVQACISEWKAFQYATRTQRMTLPVQTGDTFQCIDEVAAFCEAEGIRWFNVPFSPWIDSDFDYDCVIKALEEYEGAFCNVICAQEGRIREDILQKTARAFLEVAKIKRDGSANFRFGASMNVKPNGPFFPFTFSKGDKLSFSVGLELAEEINTILDRMAYVDLNELQKDIAETLEPQIVEIEKEASRIAAKCGVAFEGIDFSLAPLPQDGSSVITILNRLGVSNMDGTGILFATAFLTNLLKSFAARHISTGFSGVMYSLLEDAEYAKLNDEQGISMDRMISLSTMCGCGVDMVPIPYECDLEALRGILMEVACVSSRLHKPLGVRLLPVQTTVSDRTAIQSDADFICNTKLVHPRVNKLLGFTGEYDYCSVAPFVREVV